MKNSAKWGIGLGVGIPGVLILIGIICLIIKFFMKRCRKKAWYEITAIPKRMDSSDNGANHRKLPKRTSSEREPLCQSSSSSNNAAEISDNHISIPIDERDIAPGQRALEKGKEQEHTLVQVQRDRLTRLKEGESRLKPMIRLNNGLDDVQRAIDQVQKEFEESITTATTKMKRRRDK